jgi:hypothetical protein
VFLHGVFIIGVCYAATLAIVHHVSSEMSIHDKDATYAPQFPVLHRASGNHQQTAHTRSILAEPINGTEGMGIQKEPYVR